MFSCSTANRTMSLHSWTKSLRCLLVSMFFESFSQRRFYILQVKYDLLFLLASLIVWDKKSVIFLFVLSFTAFCWCLHSRYACFVCFLSVVLRWQNIATQTALRTDRHIVSVLCFSARIRLSSVCVLFLCKFVPVVGQASIASCCCICDDSSSRDSVALKTTVITIINSL